MAPTDRVVVLIDMDCFYCQVEEALNPKLKGKPIAVVQYNQWRGGGIIAVNYPAREQGVTRHMRGNDARKKCPSINLVQVPELRGKADLTKYRDAGKRVADVLATFTNLLERASVDEAYLDITDAVNRKVESGLEDLKIENVKNTFVVGGETENFLHNVVANGEFCESDLQLAVGALITEEIRREVYQQTGYKCSAGIAHNKLLAKLVCSLHKPNKQTLLPQNAIPEFFESIPINQITGLGGKFGQNIADNFGITFMGQLAKLSMKQLIQKYDEKTANWLYNIARGVNLDPVTVKIISKSIGNSKNFPGRTALITTESVQHWVKELSTELSERLSEDFNENHRKAKQIVINFSQESDGTDMASSRTRPLVSYDWEKIAQSSLEVLKKHCIKPDGTYHIKHLGISAGHFEDVKKIREITSFFKTKPKLDSSADSVDIFEDFSNKNVYLETTQELEEDESTLCFYDDKFRIKKEPEPCTSRNSDLKTNFLPISSFFQTYFDEDTRPTSPDLTSHDAIDVDPNSETAICPECGKAISINEFVCHQDYHLALKLVQESRDVLKESCKISESKENEKRKLPKSKKRKLKEINGNQRILTNFFKKDDVSESDLTEPCLECGRKIKVDEMGSHLDYHVAKKLHLEMNPVLSKSVKSSGSEKSLLSFFKRS